MANSQPRVIVIPAKPELARQKAVQRQLRVAAYCRVSTDEEEQITSYEAQKTYYTDKIMTNPKWTMAGLFADEGITGTSAKKRPEFLKMIRMCKQKKIDLILVKSISRFSRNTVDCLNYVRALKNLGIAVIFEKENLNTMEMDSEMLITMMGAFAQAESESISGNVQWGIRQAMKEGKVRIQYKWLYGYEKGEDGQPKIIPEQAEVVRRIYDSFLAGRSLRMIAAGLEADGIPAGKGGKKWSSDAIRSILRNEKYCGDALMQKTFTTDCISKKVVRNVGQLPMYLAQDNHEGIVSREKYHAVQSELARRSALKAATKKQAPTGQSCYSSKYALTERLVCGECGTLYRRVIWTQKGEKRPVWRCSSRIGYGKKYCHNSPTMDEAPLQRAILAAISASMSQKDVLIGRIAEAMWTEFAPMPGESMSLGDIDREINALTREFRELFQKVNGGSYQEYAEDFKRINDRIAALKEKRCDLLEQQSSQLAVNSRITGATSLLAGSSTELTVWNESIIRQLVDTVKVLSKDKIIVYLHGGIEIEQDVVY